MPPYWGLGFHLCRWGYGSLNGTMTVNDNMRKYGIPQDVQWNDIEYMDRHLDFTVDNNNWGGLGDFVKKLHGQYHQHYIPIVVSCSSLSYPPNFSDLLESHTLFWEFARRRLKFRLLLSIFYKNLHLCSKGYVGFDCIVVKCLFYYNFFHLFMV